MKPLDEIGSLTIPGSNALVFENFIHSVQDHLIGQMETVTRRFSLAAADSCKYHELVEQTLAAALMLRDQPTRVVGKLLMHPAFTYWLSGMRRLSVEPVDRWAEFARDLASFVWPVGLIDGEKCRSWEVRLDERGGLRCLQFGATIELGAAYANQLASVTSSPAGVQILCMDGLAVQIDTAEITSAETTLDADGSGVFFHDRLPENNIEFSNRDPSIRVNFTGTHQRNTGVEFFGTSDALFKKEIKKQNFSAAFSLIKELWNEEYAEVCVITRSVVPIFSGNSSKIAFTVSSRQGAIFLDENEPLNLVDNIIHETAHVKLRYFQIFDMLMDNFSADEPRFSVPWRKDPRPLPGIFEGAFVFMHEAEWASRLYAQGHKNEENLERKISYAEIALSIVKNNSSLSDSGTAFLNSLYDWMNNIKE